MVYGNGGEVLGTLEEEVCIAYGLSNREVDDLPASIFWRKVDFAQKRRREDQTEAYRVGAFIGWQMVGIFGEANKVPEFPKYLEMLKLGHDRERLPDEAKQALSREEEIERALANAEEIVSLDERRARKREKMGLDPGPTRKKR